MGTRLTDRGRAAVGAGVTLTLAGMFLGFRDLTRLGLTALAVAGLTVLLLRASRPRVKVETRLPPVMSAGRPTEVTLTLESVSTMSAPSTILLSIPPALGGGALQGVIPPLRAGGTLDLHRTVTPESRGVHTVPAPRLTVGDALGLARRELPVGEAGTCLVLPRIHDVDPRLLHAGTTASACVGSSFVGGEDVDAVRDYVPGDDLRRIHWPMTAHRGRLTTRHPEGSSTSRITLALDPGLCRARSASSLEWAVEFLASTVAAADRSRTTLDLRLPGGSDPSPDGRGTGREDLLSAVASTPTHLSVRERDRRDVVLADWCASAPPGSTVVLVTDADALSPRRSLPAAPGRARGILVGVAGQEPDPDFSVRARAAGWVGIGCPCGTAPAEIWQRIASDGGR